MGKLYIEMDRQQRSKFWGSNQEFHCECTELKVLVQYLSGDTICAVVHAKAKYV